MSEEGKEVGEERNEVSEKGDEISEAGKLSQLRRRDKLETGYQI